MRGDLWMTGLAKSPGQKVFRRGPFDAQMRSTAQQYEYEAEFFGIPPFISKRQDHFQDEKILRDLVGGDRAEDSITRAVRGSSYPYKMFTPLYWNFILCVESAKFLNDDIDHYMSPATLSLIAKIQQ